MLSKCFYISRASAWSRSINSVNLNGLCSRNHHVMAGGSAWANRTEEKVAKIQTLSMNQMILPRISPPCFVSQRNFSFTPSVSASAATATATATATASETVATSVIPELPVVPVTPIQDVVQSLAANGEPTFASLGLGGYSPIGLLQYALEYMHVSFDLPWYATIALSTVIIRIILTPLVIKTQQNAAIMRNVMPEMQEVQAKLSEARKMGNQLEYAQYNQELMHLMKSKGFNPIKNMMIPFAQAPIFLSYFIGIRRMVNAPVESLHTGGILWFTDLTLTDPYYVLPVITCATLGLTVHLGTEAARVPGQESPMVNMFLKALPFVIFPFIMNFPCAMVVYWASSNFCSLIQGQIFKIPRVRTYFNIPQLIQHNLPPKKKQGFVEGVKGTWTNLKMSREIEDRRRLDQINFERAGTGPLVRTYKFDPTKAKKASN